MVGVSSMRFDVLELPRSSALDGAGVGGVGSMRFDVLELPRSSAWC